MGSTYREEARTSSRPPTRYQWYLAKRPARPDRFNSAYKFVRLKLEQATPGKVVARIGARRSGASHSRPVVCASAGRAGEDQNNALEQNDLASGCYSWAYLSSSGCRKLSERVPFVPRLALIGLRASAYTRDRQISRPTQPLTFMGVAGWKNCRAQGNTTSERQLLAEEVLKAPEDARHCRFVGSLHGILTACGAVMP
jgi:hypothetical protein